MSAAVAVFARVRGRVIASPALVDAVLASAYTVAALAALSVADRHGVIVLAVGSCVAGGLAVAGRGWRPLLAAVVAVGAAILYEATTHDPNGALPPVAIILTFYALGRSPSAHGRARDGLALAVALAGSFAISAALGTASAAAAVGNTAVMALAPLIAGRLVARRVAMRRELSTATAWLRAAQVSTGERAAAEERNRVARDLHDVVAHSVSVMAVQAGAARLILDDRPVEADNALAVIGACGRDALVDLRRIVGVLHRDTDPDFGGGAGLADISRLAERIRLAGPTVTVQIDTGPQLRPAVDLVAYRVVQEALTNVVKHAGKGVRAEVRVTRDRHQVAISVTNTTATTRHEQSLPGQGLLGMRERVGALGGHVEAGPDGDGGYAVRACIPVRLDAPSDAVCSGDGRQWRRTTRLPAVSSRVVNAAMVLGWLAVMEVEATVSSARRGPLVLNVIVVAAMALAGLVRRRAPMGFLIVVSALAVVIGGGLTAFDRSTVTGLYSLAVPLFTVAAWQSRNRAIVGLTAWMVGATVAGALRGAAPGGVAGALTMGFVVWSAGRVWRTQRTLTNDVAETNRRLAVERDHRARVAVATERTRIARELHGLVAQEVVAMVVQGDAARRLLAEHDPATRAAIVSIEQSGREALTQLRRILGVLRATEPARVPTEPTQAPVVVAGDQPAPPIQSRPDRDAARSLQEALP